MGKGDKKTRKGKIAIGSYGKKRPHDVKKIDAAAAIALKRNGVINGILKEEKK